MHRITRTSAGRRTIAAVVVAAVAAAALAGAASSSHAAPASSKFVIGSVVNDLTNPFLSTMGKAEQAEAAKHGMSIKVVSGSSGGTISVSAQISEIQQFISEKVSA